jgi:hypothetical protein
MVNKVVGKEELEKQAELFRRVDVEGKKVTRTYMEQTAAEKRLTTVTAQYDKKGKETVSTQEEMIRQGPRFQMQYLGIMFGGMALNRAMANLNATSREWLGIGELTSNMMGITMLSANTDLLEFGVLPLFDALTTLPESAQRSIGNMALALEGAGALMMVGGQFMLGLFAFKDLMPDLVDRIGGVNGMLRGLAGIGVIGLGITLGIEGVRGEGGESILYLLGAGIATGLGGVLMGASLTTGIVIGGIALTAFVAIKMIADQIEYEKDLQERMRNKLYETATPEEQVFRGFSPTGGQGTRVDLMRRDQERFEQEFGGLEPFIFSQSISNKAVGGKVRTTGPHFLHQGEEVINKNQTVAGATMNVTYNVTVSDKREFEQMLRASTEKLTSDIRRQSNV